MPIDLVMITMQNNQLPILQKPVEPYFFTGKLNNISDFIQMDVRIYGDQRKTGGPSEQGRGREFKTKKDSFKQNQQFKQKKDQEWLLPTENDDVDMIMDNSILENMFENKTTQK